MSEIDNDALNEGGPAKIQPLWHLFLSENDALGAIVTTVFGEATTSPFEAAQKARKFDPPIFHVYSFDHEPDEDEIDTMIRRQLLAYITAGDDDIPKAQGRSWNDDAGNLVATNNFTDANGVVHVDGEPVEGTGQ